MIFLPTSLRSKHIGQNVYSHDIRNILSLLLFGILLSITGCASGPTRQLPEQDQSSTQPTNKITTTTATTTEKAQRTTPPSFNNFADLLKNKGDRKGVVFYLNPEGNNVLFAIKDSDTFFIADKTGTCLFQIGLSVENQTNTQQVITDVTINPGPCSLKYPDAAAEITKIVATMAEEIVIPGIQDRLSGKPWIGECSEKNFLLHTLLQKMPYDISTSRADLEEAISKIGINIKDPLELTFGDVVFFPLQKNISAVGIYLGYGLIVYHKDCSTAGVHRLSGGIQYRIYRPITGFAWTRYQIRDTDFLLNHLDAIK